jgi:hypothetical protein
MDTKKLRHFLCGLLIGAAGMQWFTCCVGETVDSVAVWLQRTADTYLADHPPPKVDTGWGPRKKPQ